jgi:hypothetical protein
MSSDTPHLDKTLRSLSAPSELPITLPLAEAIFKAAYEKLGSVPDLTSILLSVAEIAGHKNLATLKAYLAIAMRRLLQQTQAERKTAAETRAVSAERRAAASLIRLRTTGSVKELANAIESGDKKKVRQRH